MRLVCFGWREAAAVDGEGVDDQLLRLHWTEIKMIWRKMIVLVARGWWCVGIVEQWCGWEV